jgi:hypothetical protein
MAGNIEMTSTVIRDVMPFSLALLLKTQDRKREESRLLRNVDICLLDHTESPHRIT